MKHPHICISYEVQEGERTFPSATIIQIPEGTKERLDVIAYNHLSNLDGFDSYDEDDDRYFYDCGEYSFNNPTFTRITEEQKEFLSTVGIF